MFQMMECLFVKVCNNNNTELSWLRLEQLLKTSFPIEVTEERIVIFFSDVQLQNA